MTIKKIKVEIDEAVYQEIKDIATSLYPGAIPLPPPNEIIKFLIDNYKSKKSLGGAAIITNK
jgi:hypothetical protein